MIPQQNAPEQKDSENLPDQMIEANRALGRQDYISAIENLDALLKEAPDHAGAWYKKGVCLLLLQKNQEAAECLEKSLEHRPDDSKVLNDLATAIWKAGDPEKSAPYYERALELEPDYIAALNNYAALLKMAEQFDKAEEMLKKALELKPDYEEAWTNLGLIAYEQKNLKDAEEKIRKAIQINSKSANAHHNLGTVLRDMGRLDEAEQAMRISVSLNPGDANMWTDFGNVLRRLDKEEEAEEAYYKGLEADPEHELSLYNIMAQLEQTNRPEEAEKVLEDRINEKTSKIPMFALMKARLYRRNKKYEEALAAIENVEIEADWLGTYMLYEAGLVFDRLNRPAEAFRCFEQANGLMGQSNEARHTNRKIFPEITRIYREDFTKESYERWPPHMEPGKSKFPTPVFIIGFPRSGTTLLDQVLTAHGDFLVAEEEPGSESVRMALDLTYGNFTESLEDLDEDALERLRKMYFQNIPSFGYSPDDENAEYKTFVDKFPLNTVMLPILHRLFPDAKIIFAQRHPCDCVLSGFMQQFRMNPGMIQFLDIKDAANLYDGVMGVWENAKNFLPLNVHTVRYEALVEDFEGEVRQLMKFLDVEWRDSVLEYDKAAKKRDKIGTPSYQQVTEKIYTRAKGRWERYREQLEPVLDILGPWAEKYGYEV